MRATELRQREFTARYELNNVSDGLLKMYEGRLHHLGGRRVVRSDVRRRREDRGSIERGTPTNRHGFGEIGRTVIQSGQDVRVQVDHRARLKHKAGLLLTRSCTMTPMPMTPHQVKNAELPRGFRGFDEAATRQHLMAAAAELTRVLAECERLQKQVDALKQADVTDPTSAESLGSVLLTAKRAADDLLADATVDAARIREAAERERMELVARTRIDADAQVAEATARLGTVRAEEQSLRAAVAAQREELAIFLRAAARQLASLEELSAGTAGRADLDDQLLAQLPSE